MEDNAVYLADVGQNQLWSCANVVIRNGRLLTSGGMGTMGYAVPAAMGAKLADPKLQVIAGSKKAVLKWSGVKGASGYIVYRSDSKNGTYKTVKSIKGVNTLTYTNGKLRSKKSYYYKVRAYRTVGGKRIYSSYSFAKEVTVK